MNYALQTVITASLKRDQLLPFSRHIPRVIISINRQCREAIDVRLIDA